MNVANAEAMMSLTVQMTETTIEKLTRAIVDAKALLAEGHTNLV